MKLGTSPVLTPHHICGYPVSGIRNVKGLSQDDLAYEAEISRSYLSRIKKGSFHVSLKIIGRLAKALGVEPAEFLKPQRVKR